MKQSYLTSKLYEVLLANNLIAYGDPFPTKKMSLSHFFELFQQSGRLQDVEQIKGMKNLHEQDLLTSLVLDLPVAIYDESENRVFYMVRNGKDVTIAVPVMMGICNRYQVYSTNKKLAEELKDLGETVNDEEVLEKLFDLKNRIENPIITAVQQAEVVEIAPKSQIETLLESGIISSVTRPEPVTPIQGEDATTQDAGSSDAETATEAGGLGVIATADVVRELVDDNNSQDSAMREHLRDALARHEEAQRAGQRKGQHPNNQGGNKNHQQHQQQGRRR